MAKREVSFLKIAEKSIDHTKAVLFQPFQLKKWLKLVFIAFLAGALSSGGGNFNFPSGVPTEAPETEMGEAIQDPADPTAAQANAPTAGTQSAQVGAFGQMAGEGAQGNVQPIFIMLMIVLVLGLIVFTVVFMWLGSRFGFVWFNAITKNETSIKAPFHDYRLSGNSYFKFNLLATVLVVLLIAGTVGAAFLMLTRSGIEVNDASGAVAAVFMFLIPVLLLVGFMIVISLFFMYVMDFVIPIMAIDNCKIGQGLKTFFKLFSENKVDFILYPLAKLLFGIATAILGAIVMIAWLILVAILALILFGLPWLLIVGALKLAAVYAVGAVIVGIPFIAAVFISFLFITLVFAVFFRSFSLYFLSSLKTRYVPLPI